MGVTDLPIESDLYSDMVFAKCNNCKTVQLKKLIPLFVGFKLLTFTGFLTYIMNR